MSKTMKASRCRTIRELVEYVNDLNIQQQDIVTILQDRGEIVLVYYGEDN